MLAAVGKPDYIERNDALGYELGKGVLEFLKMLGRPSGEQQVMPSESCRN